MINLIVWDEFYCCLGVEFVGRVVFKVVDMVLEEFDFLEFYICFFIVQDVYVVEFGILCDIDWSFIGVMLFVGGFFNSFVFYVIGQLVEYIWIMFGSCGMVIIVFGVFIKQGFVIWGVNFSLNGYQFIDVIEDVEKVVKCCDVVFEYFGEVMVVGYMVMYE